jgi:hypothetical protein
MEAIFLKLIDQLNSAVVVLVIVLFIAFWATFKMGSIISLFNSFKEKNKEFDTGIGFIKDNLATIKATTDLLYQAHLSTVKSHSPISLTEIGTNISSALRIEDKVTNHWEVIREEIEKKSPASPYDIQNMALELSRHCFDFIFNDAEKIEIKNYAYSTGINILEIYPIIGVIVRDRYLKEKNIPVTAVDDHISKTV